MKQMKMLGLAAVAALGLMAFVGAGTSSATTLSTDAAGTVLYGANQEIHATLKAGTSSSLKDTSGSVIATCTESTVKGTIGVASGTWVSGAIGALNWPAASCSQGTVGIANGSLEIMQTVGDEGEVIGRGSEVTLAVFGVSCVYGTGVGTRLGTIKGGAESELAITATLLKTAGGFLCPSSGIWTSTYIVTTPHALHIVA